MNSFQLQKWNIYNWHESSSFQKPKHVSGGLYALFSAQERDWPRKRDSREMQSDWCSRYSVMENGMISAPKISLFSPILDAIPSHLMKRKSQTKQKCIPSGTRAIGKGILGIWEWLNPFIAPRFRGLSIPTSWFLWLKHSYRCHILLHEQEWVVELLGFCFSYPRGFIFALSPFSFFLSFIWMGESNRNLPRVHWPKWPFFFSSGSGFTSPFPGGKSLSAISIRAIDHPPASRLFFWPPENHW